MSHFPLANRTALVTGAGRGLGAALCVALGAAGARLIVADIRAGLAEASADSLHRHGYVARPVRLDVSDAGQVAACVAQASEREGGIDILINNAGVDFTRALDTLEISMWDHVLGTNLRGPFLLCKQVAGQMQRRGSGHIVNICSTAAKRTWPNASAYHASKWGLLGLSHALHAELRPFGVRVTAVIAGGMRTPFLLERFPDIDPATLQAPEDVAAAIVAMLGLPGASVIPEMTILPLGESSWP